MVIYFTGTGNSRFAAVALAKALGDETVDAGRLMRAGAALSRSSEIPWVFVCPTYSWQMPRVFGDFLRRCSFSGCQDAYFVLTCGGEIGAAGETARQLCGELGLKYRGTMGVVMPDNYIVLFKAPPADRAARIIEKAEPVLQQAARRIRDGEAFPERKPSLIAKLKSSVINRGFYQYFIKADEFLATDKCVGCGKCAGSCPLNNITMEAGRPVWGSRCTQCMACISLCPLEAVEYGKKTVGKPRYRCPEQKVEELE